MQEFKTFSTDIYMLYPLYLDYRVIINIYNGCKKFFKMCSYNSIKNMNADMNLYRTYRDYLVEKFFFDNVRKVLHIKLIPFNDYLRENEETKRVSSYYSYEHEDHHKYEQIISKMMDGGFSFHTDMVAKYCEADVVATEAVIKAIDYYKQQSPRIENVISNDPATIVFWNDGSKTVVKAEDEDSFDLEKGILYAALKKHTNKKEYDNILRAIDSAKEKE